MMDDHDNNVIENFVEKRYVNLTLKLRLNKRRVAKRPFSVPRIVRYSIAFIDLSDIITMHIVVLVWSFVWTRVQ